MDRKKLKQILYKYTDATSTVISWLNGNRRPSYEIMVQLHKDHKIPFTAWEDIKAYLCDSKKKEAVASQSRFLQIGFGEETQAKKRVRGAYILADHIASYSKSN